jgi:hemolysin III
VTVERAPSTTPTVLGGGVSPVGEDLPQLLADTITGLLDKPRARGWIHLVVAALAVVAGTALVAVAALTVSSRAGWATLVYAAAIIALFSVSAI